MTLVILAHFFLVRGQIRLKIKAPRLSLAQVCLLLHVLLPAPQPTLDRVLERLAYYDRRHAAAERAHRQRTERWIANRDAPIDPQTLLLAPPIRA